MIRNIGDTMASSKGKTGTNTGLVARQDWIGSIARFWQRTYAPDYVGLTFLLASYIFVRSSKPTVQ
jgi:diacylglycerol diphosphate phosphatase/phosphatidate phosphatase